MHIVVIDENSKTKFDETENIIYNAHASSCAWSSNDG